MSEDTKKSAEIVWNRCLKFIQDNLTPEAYNTWFTKIDAIKLVDNVLYIEVPSRFFYEWLEENYVHLLKSALTKELNDGARLIYRIRDKAAKGMSFTENIPSSRRGKVPTQSLNVPIKQKAPERMNPFVIPGIRDIEIDSKLNSNYSFDNFIEGSSNKLARTAAQTVANCPGGTSFNPLLIYGGVGLGKTHLAHAIGVEIKEKHPDKTVLYISAEVFSQQYTESVRRKTRNDFIHFYQLIDVLIVDDIQFLSGKPGTQDVFFHIFNYLHQNGKQVVLTSDRAPINIKDVEQRLLSRFKWGLSSEIEKPDYETRVKIVKNRLYRDGVEMNEDVIEYVAKYVNTNIRELEGAVVSLIARSSFIKEEITVEMAEKAIENYVSNIKRELSIDSIETTVADMLSIDIELIKSKSRKRDVVQARQLIMYFSKKFTKNSLASIGAKIGKRNHATVLYACRTVEDLIETNKEFRKVHDELMKKITR